MVCVSASVNLPLHHKVQKFSSGTGLSGWSQEKGRKTVMCVCVYDDKDDSNAWLLWLAGISYMCLNGI